MELDINATLDLYDVDEAIENAGMALAPANLANFISKDATFKTKYASAIAILSSVTTKTSYDAEGNYVDPWKDAKLQIRFTSQGPFDVLVEFEGGIYLNIGFYSSNRIYTSTVVIGKEHVYWVNDAEDGLKESEVKDYKYIQAKKLRWKFIVKEENDW